MTLIRLPNFERKDYLFKKRMAIIQKAHLPLHYRIQMIHNQAIDERILNYYGDVDEDVQSSYTVPAYKEEILLSRIGAENLRATHQDFERLARSSRFGSEDSIARMERLNATRKISDKITRVEVDVAQKNLAKVDKILTEGELELNTYKTLIEKLPRTVSREDILQKALKDGYNFKGREYSQKQLDKLSAQLENYKQNAIRYEKGLKDNRQANREGLPSPNPMKRWLWSQLENTRHFEMDRQEVRYSEYFTVVNERTGQTDFLRFPRDIENDSNNCANICNCQCEWETF